MMDSPSLCIADTNVLIDLHNGGVLAAMFLLPYPTARGYVDPLEKGGMLREITGQARNRVYRADEIMQAIEAPLEVER